MRGMNRFNLADLTEISLTQGENELAVLQLARCLATKGYCIIDGSFHLKRDEILAEIYDLQRDDCFETPPHEVAEGLLGSQGSSRIADLSQHHRHDGELRVIEQNIFSMASLISSVSQAHLGFELGRCTPGLIHEAGDSNQEFPEISHVQALKWYNIFSTHRVMCMAFLGPAQGLLELRPYDMDSNVCTLEVKTGRWVYLLPTCLSHRFQCQDESYVLTSFLLQNVAVKPVTRVFSAFPLTPAAQKMDAALQSEPERWEEDLPRDTERILHHLHARGIGVAVRGAACKVPANLAMGSLWQGLCNGIDCASLVPSLRWDHSQFYDPDSSQVRAGKIPCQHGAFVDGVELFDNRMFRISPFEAQTMAPEQRHTLEVGYATLFDAGLRKKDIENSSTGVYTGASWNEWNVLKPMDSKEQGSFGATSNMSPITANRVSYVLGFNGPSLMLNTEGSASLVALCMGADALEVVRGRRKNEQSLCMGISLVLSPAFMLSPALARVLSAKGRCFTFDECADGYICADGCAGALLNPLADAINVSRPTEEVHSRGVICSSRSFNVGKSAALNAPNGPADQRLLAAAISDAGISPFDVELVDCHGIGSIIADAVEVLNLASVLRSKKSDEPLCVASTKTSLANMRACAGLGGFVRIITSAQWGVPTPNCHSRVVNPHIDIADTPMLFTDESLPFMGSTAFTGVTSKGFGGTVAHVIAWGAMEQHCESQHETLRSGPQILYWPGGGGDLHDTAYPDEGYSIKGSWSAWQKMEMMNEEQPGVFGYTVTLNEHCLEHFQIYLDKNPSRVLHPDTHLASADSTVCGPDSDADFIAWRLGGCMQADVIDAASNIDEAEAVNVKKTLDSPNPESIYYDLAAASSRPGDQYRIRLYVHGKWRKVSWEKLSDVSLEQPRKEVTARYFIYSDWNNWEIEEMTQETANSGLFSCEVCLKRRGGMFQICVNRDLDQILYPSTTGSVNGPAPRELSRCWCLDGSPGNVFRIEFRYTQGSPMTVSWTKLHHEDLSPTLQAELNSVRYFIAGSWDGWAMHEMAFNGNSYTFPVTLHENPVETFRIYVDGDWDRAFYPNINNATPFGFQLLQGPDGNAALRSWAIGYHERDPSHPGMRYEVRFHFRGGKPYRVDWVPAR